MSIRFGPGAGCTLAPAAIIKSENQPIACAQAGALNPPTKPATALAAATAAAVDESAKQNPRPLSDR